MKKFTAAAAVCLALLLCACGSRAKNGLFSAAAPETSAMMLYVCEDGENVRRMALFENGSERQILDRLSEVKAEPAQGWTPGDVTMPVYAVEIGRNDGEAGWLGAAWSNGYLIMPDGTAYEFDFDFAAVEKRYAWIAEDGEYRLDALPCSRALAQDGNGWINRLLSPARELCPPEGISLAKAPAEDAGSVSVVFENGLDTQWCFGEYFHLEVQLDGRWYVVPPETELAFNDIGYILPAGGTQEKTYSLAPYGELPDGLYRLVAEGMSVELRLLNNDISPA